MGNIKKEVMEKNELTWWGYLHVSGSIHLKRYFSDLDLEDAKNSPFVDKILPKFSSANSESALEYLKNHLLGSKQDKDERLPKN